MEKSSLIFLPGLLKTSDTEFFHSPFKNIIVLDESLIPNYSAKPCKSTIVSFKKAFQLHMHRLIIKYILTPSLNYLSDYWIELGLSFLAYGIEDYSHQMIEQIKMGTDVILD